MDDKEVVSDLVRCLANLFESSDEIKGLAQDAGLNTTHIKFEGTSAFELWRRVVKRAKDECKLIELVDAALRDLGVAHPELITIKEKLLVGIVRRTGPDSSMPPNEKKGPLKPSDETARAHYIRLPITLDAQVGIPSEKSTRQLEETLAASASVAPGNLTKQRQNIFFSFRSLLDFFRRNSGIASIISVVLVIAILTGINLILLCTPWPTDMLTIIPLVIIFFTLAFTLIILVLLILTYNKLRLFNKRLRIINSIFLLAFMLINITFPIFFLYNVQYSVSSSIDPSTQAPLWILVLLTIVIIFIGTIILLIAVFLVLAGLVAFGRSHSLLLLAYGGGWGWLRRRWAIVGSIILLIVMLVSFTFSNIVLHTMQNIANSIEYAPRVGLCDGRCVVDVDRLNGLLKVRAANELNQQHRNAACAYLDWATKEDTTDGEAKIDYENQCSSAINGTLLHCPCINYVVAITLTKEIPATLTAKDVVDTVSTDPAIYNNGANRSILQGVYLQQKAWNAAHKNGPAMYIFVANVGDVSDLQHASQWQQQVAKQIVSLQQTESEHHINGVVGLPQGTDTLIALLNQDAIPMISTGSMSAEEFSNQNYLLAIAPTIEQEMFAATYFLTKEIIHKKTFHMIVYYYKFNGQYQGMASTFNSNLANIGEEQSYDDLPQDTTADVMHLATYAANNYDAIFFAGPVNDLLTFVKTLRQTDQVTPVLASNTAYQLVYNYLPPTIKSSLLNLYFTAFAYHETERYTGLPRSQMITNFNKAYDPKSIHSGDIYTYQLPTSDAILAYDSMGVFTYLIEHYGAQHLPNWQDQKVFLAYKPLTLVSGSVRFALAGDTPLLKTVLLLQIGPGGNTYLDKVH